MKQANLEVLQWRFPHIISNLKAAGEFDRPVEPVVYERFEKDHVWLQAVEQLIADSKIVFVYGFGQGLSIADLLEKFPDRWLFVYEPDAASFQSVLTEYDLACLLEHSNLHWISVGDNQRNMLFYLLCTYLQKQLSFIALRKYLEEEMEVLHDIKRDFVVYQKEYESNKFVENRFRNEWTQNYLYHLHETFTSHSIEQMQQAFQGMDAIIVSSGPSLTEDMEWIRKSADHAVIIAAGSSVQALVKHGVEPHLCVIMDGHAVNDKIFSASPTLQPTLLFTTSSFYEISERKQTDKLYSIMKNDLVTQYFLQLDDSELLMIPTASVAGTAVQAAAFLGAQRIIFAGQDLSYPLQKVYSDGIDHFSAAVQSEMLQKAVQQIRNVQGGYNSTDSSFMLMKEGLEELIRQFKTIQFVNSTRNGAVIEGAPFRPIEHIYEELRDKHVPRDLIRTGLKEHPLVVDTEKLTNLRSKMEFVQADFIHVQAEMVVIQKLLRNIQLLSRTKPLKCQNRLVEIEERWGKIAHRDWFAPLFESLLPLQLARFDQMLPTIVMEQNVIEKSRYIYDVLGGLLVHMEEHLPRLQKFLEQTTLRLDRLLCG